MEIWRPWSSKYYVCIFLFGNFVFFTFLYLPQTVRIWPGEVVINQTFIENKDYLVYSSKCMIPNLDPWNEEIKPYYKKESYVSCSKYNLLTYVQKNDTNAILRMDQKAAKLYSKKPIKCCYSNVTRNTKAKVPDDDIEFSNCTDFEGDLDISGKTVTVKCRVKDVVYSNTHAPVTITQEIEDKMSANSDVSNSKDTPRRLSVLFVGIDSISRLNFIRTMPKTREFLNDTEWIEYKGYNKIGDNTFPNLLAILTGKQLTAIYKECDPFKLGGLDKCEFIWKDYERFGYVTAYAEDESTINTFNYHKKGFKVQPTDYYFRSYSVASGRLNKKRVDEMNYCTGPESSGERILNVALDFATTFQNYTNFGFFWMNSFSHNKLNSPTRMDAKVSQFFRDLYKTSYFKNSMIIFLSDHGIRFGNVRTTNTGWLEERLPFLYFWLPEWFREKYPEKYFNLKTNGNVHLTTPYDLYMTLQDALVLSGFKQTVKPSEGCLSCKSLFEVLPFRSCEEAVIDTHWCTCYGYKRINIDDVMVTKASQFIVEQLNKEVSEFGKESKKCAKFDVSKVIRASVSTETPNKDENYLLIIVKTVPEAIIESTITMVNDSIKTGSYLSRLDSYSRHSKCVKNADLKKYCYCK